MEVVLLHVSESWLEKAKEMAMEHLAPQLVQKQIETILDQYGVDAIIACDRRVIDDLDEPPPHANVANDGQYL